jgi:hypothetical protein
MASYNLTAEIAETPLPFSASSASSVVRLATNTQAGMIEFSKKRVNGKTITGRARQDRALVPAGSATPSWPHRGVPSLSQRSLR